MPSAGKVMATIFWDAQRILLTDYLPRGQTITGSYYAQLVLKLREAIKEKRRGKLQMQVFFSSGRCACSQESHFHDYDSQRRVRIG
jgi:hypothetical protein